MAALEAMACETAVVASNVGGLPEIIQHGVTGFLYPMDATADMADRVVTLIQQPEHRQAIGQAAAIDVRERFCEERVVPMYEACYSAQ